MILQGSRRDFYRQTISKLTAGLAHDDRSGRESIYARMRSTNESYIEKNRDRLSEPQIRGMREQLDDAIADTEATFSEPAAQEPVRDPVLDLLAHEPVVAEPVEELPAAVDPAVADDLIADADAAAGIQPLSAEPDEAPSTPAPAPVRASSRFMPGLLVGALAGIILSVGALYAWPQGDAASAGGEASEEMRLRSNFDAAMAESLPIVTKQIALLATLETALVEKQKAEGRQVEKVAGRRFVPIQDVLPQFADEVKAIDEPRMKVVVRAGADAYKIMINTTQCPAARIAHPDRVDRKRAEKGLGCHYISVSNEEGADF